MEYYFFAPIGILLSQKVRMKEEVFQLLKDALASESTSVVQYLQRQGVQPVLTLVAPRIKFGFDLENQEIVEMR